MPVYTCAQCHRPTSTPTCRACMRANEERRGTAAQRGLDREWRKVRDAVRAAWIEANGLICPGWARPPHPVSRVTDLTGDHRIPRSRGGTNDPANVAILCKRCNSAKGAAA